MKISRLWLIAGILISSFFLTSCDDLEEIDARKRSEDSAYEESSTTFVGPLNTLTDPFNLCSGVTGASATLDLEDNTVFSFAFEGTQELEEVSALFQFESMAYTNTTDFTGIVIANDSADDFAAVATGCSTFGGYSNVVEASLSGSVINNGQALSNTTQYEVAVRCVNPGQKSTICAGTFNGTASPN